MNTITSKIENLQIIETRRIIFNIFMSVLILLSVVYAYLIGSITFNILARKTLEKQLYTIKNNVSSLELTYLNDLNKIDKNYALALGYVNVKDTIFANRINTSVAIR